MSKLSGEKLQLSKCNFSPFIFTIKFKNFSINDFEESII